MKKTTPLALFIGAVITILIFTIPRPQTVGYYDGPNNHPSSSEFSPGDGQGEGALCMLTGLDSSFSKLSVGFPIKKVIVVDGSLCSGQPSRLETAKIILTKAPNAWQFYGDWAVWALSCFAIAYFIKKKE